jgi:hypothetical protein
MPNDDWPRCCPRCGHPTLSDGFWYVVEPTMGLRPGTCWECDYMHPWFERAHEALTRRPTNESDREREVE